MIPGLPYRRHFKDLSDQEIVALAISSEEDDARIYRSYAARLREAGSIAARHIEIALREANVVSQDILDTLYEATSTEALHADQTA